MLEDEYHPAFPQPEDLEIDVWRYLDLDKFEWLIENKRLFMPVAEKLGEDPLEGTQPTGDLEWWKEQTRKAQDEEKRSIIERNSKIILGFSSAFRKNYFVSCWHMNSTENNKMWSCYTESPESVAIRTTYNNLKILLPEHVYIGTVRYIDYSSDKLPTFNIFEYITHKDISYTFENEARAVAAALTEAHWESEQFKGNIFELEANPGFICYAPPIDVVSLVQDIVFHPEATNEFKEKITAICSKQGLPRPIDSKL